MNNYKYLSQIIKFPMREYFYIYSNIYFPHVRVLIAQKFTERCKHRRGFAYTVHLMCHIKYRKVMSDQRCLGERGYLIKWHKLCMAVVRDGANRRDATRRAGRIHCCTFIMVTVSWKENISIHSVGNDKLTAKHG